MPDPETVTDSQRTRAAQHAAAQSSAEMGDNMGQDGASDAEFAADGDYPGGDGRHQEAAYEVLVGSAQPLAISTLDDTPPVSGAGVTSVGGSGKSRIGDRVFSGLASGSGIFVILLVSLVGVFLVIQAIPAIKNDKGNFFGHQWTVSTGTANFGISGLLWATVIASVIAMIIAVPIAVGIALFMTQYAPKRLVAPIGYVIDLLAAVPSIIYGIWGFTILSGYLAPVQRVLYHLGGLPIFKDQGFITGSIFDGGVVLAIMILPIITAISRDVFARTPRQNIEGAWALGATRWEMIRLAVIPYGRAGVVSGSMLGLGRALGETIAISLILAAPSPNAPFHSSIFGGGETFASKIANSSGEFANNPGPYIAAGLVLFVLTFVVNAAARTIVNRKAFSS
jgi:phosphate transport system permease protein